MSLVLSPRSISWIAAKLRRQRHHRSSSEGFPVMVGKSSCASAKISEVSLGEVTVLMAARGQNSPLVVASLLLEVS